jgi:hypothetical protein
MMEQIATYQTLVLGLIVMSTATEAHLNALFGPLVEWRDFVAPVAVHLILMWTRLFVIAVGLMGTLGAALLPLEPTLGPYVIVAWVGNILYCAWERLRVSSSSASG